MKYEIVSKADVPMRGSLGISNWITIIAQLKESEAIKIEVENMPTAHQLQNNILASLRYSRRIKHHFNFCISTRTVKLEGEKVALYIWKETSS